MTKAPLFYVLFIFYIYIGILFTNFVFIGVVEPLASHEPIYVDPASSAMFSQYAHMTSYFQQNFVREDGFIYLYKGVQNSSHDDFATNSEALSYYLLWNAQENNKEAFDVAVGFIESSMLNKDFGYLQWRIDADGNISKEGSNLASDADLRAIKALFIAKDTWGDTRYKTLIDLLSQSLERMAITQDHHFAPYAGIAGKDDVWQAKEIWLSYADFTVFNRLGKEKGEPWLSVYNTTRQSFLDAQIYVGLYNSVLTEKRDYGNGIDAGGYGINSLWMMIRAAESGDPLLQESARKSLMFYKQKMQVDNELYALYDSEGSALEPSDTPWVYALVGRAASELGDKEFAQLNVERMNKYYSSDGAIYEGTKDDARVGQFTMQEIILMFQSYMKQNLALEFEEFYTSKKIHIENYKAQQNTTQFAAKPLTSPTQG